VDKNNSGLQKEHGKLNRERWLAPPIVIVLFGRWALLSSFIDKETEPQGGEAINLRFFCQVGRTLASWASHDLAYISPSTPI
jgi:hypothetical protein